MQADTEMREILDTVLAETPVPFEPIVHRAKWDDLLLDTPWAWRTRPGYQLQVNDELVIFSGEA